MAAFYGISFRLNLPKSSKFRCGCGSLFAVLDTKGTLVDLLILLLGVKLVCLSIVFHELVKQTCDDGNFKIKSWSSCE